MKHRMPLIATALLMVAAALLVVPAQAAENQKLADLNTSLNQVPEDAAFYLGMFRGGEQIEAIGKSRAWAKLMQSPGVQLALKTYEKQKEEPQSPANKVNMMLQDPQTQDLLALLGDMFDDEAFIYGDASLVKTIALFQKVQRLSQLSGLESEMKSPKLRMKLSESRDMEEIQKLLDQMQNQKKDQMKEVAKLLVKNIDDIKVPTILFGSKLDDTDRAELNLGKLEFILSMAMMGIASQEPELDLSGVLARKQIDGGTFLVLKLSGNLIPFDEEPEIQKMAEEDENAAKIIEKLKSENLVIAVGTKGDYLLASIGSSTEAIEKFGHHKATLVNRPEMAKLEPYADKPVTDISYASKDLACLLATGDDDLDFGVKMANTALDSAKELNDQAKAEIREDVTKLHAELKKVWPTVGATASIGYMTPTGSEGYCFQWRTGDPDNKPLELINHLGGSPILGIVAACPLDVETYDAIVYWLGVGHKYFEKYAVPTMSKREQAEYKEHMELFGPLGKEFHKITREKFLPAFGGEFGIQLDAELTLSTIPDIDQSMPMLEPAIILAVKDRDLMDDALEGYWKLINKGVKIAVENCDDMPKTKLPEPKTVKNDAGTMYVFPLPSDCPVHAEVKPTVGLGKDTLVFAVTPEAATRLMTKTPLTYGGALADAKKPRVIATCIGWENLLTA
ncbi:MAG: hypothetical protein PVH19_05300, partial [Planctomycetia bacterium]